MKMNIIPVFLVAFFFTAQASAESVKSGSKYPIVVEVYKGKNITCNAKEGEITSAVKGVAQSYKDTKGNTFDKLKNAVGQAINSAMRGSGCELIGQAVVIESGKAINVPVGTTVVAYKDPFVAWSQYNKIVNPIPAVCEVKAGKTISLETRKSSLLLGIFGSGGDGGLSCK
jgi:hypothetical protein